eukprot:18345_1
MGFIIIYTITGCKYCKAAKSLFKELNVPCSVINLDNHPDRRKEMIELSQRKTVPQIFFNMDHIGGFDDLKKLEYSGELVSKINRTLESPPPKEMIRMPSSTDLDSSDSAEEDDESKSSAEKRWEYLSSLAREMHTSQHPLEIKDRRYRLHIYKKCFIGSAVLEWLEINKNISPTAAFEIMNEMFYEDIIHHVANAQPFRDGFFFYRFQSDEEHTALNMSNICKKGPRDATVLGHKIRARILEMYNEFLSSDGSSVDYEGLSKSELFEKYCALTEDLQNCDVFSLEHHEKLAFWINIYNALVIHGRVVNGQPKGHFQRAASFRNTKYNIGGYEYSLDDMENGVLRANRPGSGKFQKQFSSDDPRIEAMVNQVDPRIHFTLVCGAKSCPPIKLFNADSIDEDLNLATEAFLDDETFIDVKNGEFTVSMILKWYRTDFGRNDMEVMKFVQRFMPEKKQAQLDSILNSASFRLKYTPYDWDSNSK